MFFRILVLHSLINCSHCKTKKLKCVFFSISFSTLVSRAKNFHGLTKNLILARITLVEPFPNEIFHPNGFYVHSSLRNWNNISGLKPTIEIRIVSRPSHKILFFLISYSFLQYFFYKKCLDALIFVILFHRMYIQSVFLVSHKPHRQLVFLEDD